ncbi:dentin sialophosphoprotein-like, partial [Littorina saxatilis]
MVKTCCAPNCRNRSKTPGISFFCFPKSPHLRREWIRRVNKANFQPTRHTVLCSDHFHSDSFLNESVPEFLQLIGLEQRPVRRRLKHGSLPTLFRITHNGWEERGEERREMGGERGMEEGEVKREGGGMDEQEEEEENTDEEDRFVIQMDVAEEDREMSEDPQGADQPLGDPNQAHHPSQPFHDYHNDQESHTNTSTGNTTHAHSEYSNNGTGDDIGNSFDTETYSARNPDARNNADKENDSQDSMESSSSRPRRSCRGRRWGGGGGDDGYVKDSHASQAISTEDGDKGTSHKKKQSGQQKAINEEGEGSGNSVKTKEQEQDDFCNDRSKLQDSGEGRGAGKKDDDEPRLFTIESVRTVTENEEMDEEHDDKDEVGKDDDSSGTYSPGASDTSSPPAKKRKSSSKKSSASHPQPVLLNQQPGAAPIFCRIDPAFCKFQTVFQVPFASSPTFFSRTADSMVVSNGTNVSTAIANDGDNNSVAESSKTSPKSVSLLANRSDTAVSADNAGDKSDPLSRRVIKSPAAIPAKHISITPPTSDASPADPASVCTLPCCSGKPSNPVIASLPFKPMDIKQEAPDPDDPSQPQPDQTVRTLSPPSSLPASVDPVPYRSDPIFLARTSTTVSSSNTINTNSSGSSVVPYRSEPLRKLPRPLPPISALPADFSHKIETREKGHSCQSWSRSDSQMTQENGSRSDSQPTQESFQTKQESFNGNDYPPGKKSLINDITPQ